MVRKQKLAIVIAGTLLLAGVAFGVSTSNRDGLKSDILESRRGGNTITVGLGNTPKNIEVSGYVKGGVFTSVSFMSKQDIVSMPLKSIDFGVKSVEGELPNLDNFNLRSYNDTLLSQYKCIKRNSTQSKQFLVSCKLIKGQEPAKLSGIWLDASIKTEGAGKMRITPTNVTTNTTKVKFSYTHPGTLVQYQSPSTYIWHVSDWSSCTNNEQKITIYCTDENDFRVDDSYCSITNKPVVVETIRSCRLAGDQYFWTTSDWQTCSNNVQTRYVACTDGTGTTVNEFPDNYCSGTKPLATKSCQ